MGKASSSKKVQRAARAAASSRGASERRELGFPLVVGITILLGIALVVVANTQQDDDGAVASATLGDHLHNAYVLHECDTPLEPLTVGQNDPEGIDSLIHFQPLTSAGTAPTVGMFLEAMGAEFDGETLTSEEHGTLAAGGDCDGEEALWRAARFTADGELVEEFDEGIADIQLTRADEALTLALVPADAEIPAPPDDVLDQLALVADAEAEAVSPPVVIGADDAPDADTEPGSETDTEPESDAESEPETDTEPEPDTEAEPSDGSTDDG